ncbi:MAG: hypothetical protein ISP90_14960 [Nevskia sp.]|nr:hypothetical protein [Nevskia sp.]
MRSLREFFDDPRRAGLTAVAGGLAKGAVVGLAVGKLGLGVAAGLAGGAAVGAALAWRARRLQVRAHAAAGKAR